MAATSRAVPVRRRRRGALLIGGVLGALAFVGFPAASRAAGRHPAITSFPHGLVHLDGHGFGPGVGMGQWGAFGYAAEYHKKYQWILSHFYGGTLLRTLRQHPDPVISVALVKDDGSDARGPVVVSSQKGFRFGGVPVAPGHAAEAVLDRTTGTWSILRSHSCAGADGWSKVASGLKDPVARLGAQAPVTARLTVCFPHGTTLVVQGAVKAYAQRSPPAKEPVARVINLVRLDNYVAGVVPAESSSGWGSLGGRGPQGQQWGFQELEAQAVAARTYTLAYIAHGGWGGYADISDSPDCQSYPGVEYETSVSDAAASDTAGQYLVLHRAPAPTEYSASSGGYTVGGAFPAVPDAGDAICLQSSSWSCNPNHTWHATIPVRELEKTFPAVGPLRAISVVARNGLGVWGGRALTVLVVGARGRQKVSGDDFQWDFGLASNWIRFTNASSASASSPAADGSGTGPLSRSGGGEKTG